MKKIWWVALLGLAVIGLAAPSASAQPGQPVVGVSAGPGTPVPAAVFGPFELPFNNCADALQQALAGPFDMKIVEASQVWAPFFGPALPFYAYTLVGNGKRTLILMCALIVG